MNQTPPAPDAHPDESPERDAPIVRELSPHAAPEPERSFVMTPHPADELAGDAREPVADAAPPVPPGESAAEAETQARQPAEPPAAARIPTAPPPLPTLGASPQPPRMAPPPQRVPEQAPYAPQPQPSPYAQPQAPYPPRPPAPQPASSGGFAEPPRPYEGGRYVPPPPIPPAGPTAAPREWATAPPAAVPVVTAPARGNPANTTLLGVIAVLLLALAIFQGINTFHPKAANPTGVQQVAVQPRALKPETASKVKDTVDNAQQAIDQFNQVAQQAYSSASNDQQRLAILMQLSLQLQRIIAQQNNDLLLIYQDLNS